MGGVVSVRIFGHYVSLPLVLLMLVEAAMHVGAVYLPGAVRFLDIHFVIYSSGGNYGWLLPRAQHHGLELSVFGCPYRAGAGGVLPDCRRRNVEAPGSRARERIARGRG